MECCKVELRVKERRQENGQEYLLLECPVCKRTEKKEITREQEPETPAL